jgi:hypothetical protein
VRDLWIAVYLYATTSKNAAFLERLRKRQRRAIDKQLGATTEWGRKWVAISLEVDPSNETDWERQHQWMKSMLEKLLEIFSGYPTRTLKGR